jgi:tRNA nucleotidyltransferase (CCA-adding enzyme)
MDRQGHEYALACQRGKKEYMPITLEEDLANRDLTINAMAQDLETGEIIDPFGGLKDLEKKVLRHTSDAFRDDPLRILRCARFSAQLNFQIADETYEMMTSLKEEVAATAFQKGMLSSERIWNELVRALSSEHPRKFFEALDRCGSLPVLFPELTGLKNKPQPVKHHPEVCTFEHTLLVVEEVVKLTKDPTVRFAALVHDLGKGLTPPDILPSHHGHEKAGVPLVESLCQRLKAPNDFTELAKKVSLYHLNCHKAFDLKPGTLVKLLTDIGAYRDELHLERFLLACEADARGRLGLSDRDYPQPDFLREIVRQTKGVSGQTFVNQGKEGKKVGVMIHEARTRIVKDIKRRWEMQS